MTPEKQATPDPLDSQERAGAVFDTTPPDPPVSPLARFGPRRPDGTYKPKNASGPLRPKREAKNVTRRPVPGRYAAAIEKVLDPTLPAPTSDLHRDCRSLLTGAVAALRARATEEEIPTLTPRERNTLRFLIDLCKDLREEDRGDDAPALDLGAFDADTIRLMLVEAKRSPPKDLTPIITCDKETP